MEDGNGKEINLFNINSEVYVWEIRSGLPELIRCRVTNISLFRGDIVYELKSFDGEIDNSFKEINIFASIEEAVKVFNEGQDPLILSVKEPEE